MRIPTLILGGLLLAPLAACIGDQEPPEAPPAQPAPVERGPFGADAVWNGDISSCLGDDQVQPRCLESLLHARGASDNAQQVARELEEAGNPGYVSAWQETDGVGLAILTFPFRANTNEGTWLVASDGQTVDVDVDVLTNAARAREDVRHFLTLHPAAFAVAPALAAGSEPLPDGGVRLIYATPMRNCRACPDEGTLRIGYDFDKDRRYTGQQVIDLQPVVE